MNKLVSREGDMEKEEKKRERRIVCVKRSVPEGTLFLAFLSPGCSHSPAFP